jgi:ethanolamine utilization protein EutN
MLPAHVIGTATSTVKHPSLQGCRLLIVQPQLNDGRTPDGEPLVAADLLGAGVGQTVIITSDGRQAQELLESDTTPVRWTVMGIRDE